MKYVMYLNLLFIHVYLHMHVYIHVYIYACMYVCVYTNIYIYVCLYTCVCMQGGVVHTHIVTLITYTFLYPSTVLIFIYCQSLGAKKITQDIFSRFFAAQLLQIQMSHLRVSDFTFFVVLVFLVVILQILALDFSLYKVYYYFYFNTF